MALTVKLLGIGQVRRADYGTDENVLYSAPTTPLPRSAVISSIVFVNNQSSVTVANVSVFLRKAADAITNRKKVGFYKDLASTATTGDRYLIEDEITLGPGDTLYADVGPASDNKDKFVDYTVYGVERDI